MGHELDSPEWCVWPKIILTHPLWPREIKTLDTPGVTLCFLLIKWSILCQVVVLKHVREVPCSISCDTYVYNLQSVSEYHRTLCAG